MKNRYYLKLIYVSEVIINIIINATNEDIVVPKVQVLKVVLKSKFKYCLNNQKPGSFTCEQNILPDAILNIINTAEYVIFGTSGSTIARVVIAAIVALPKEILNIAATKKLIIIGDKCNPFVSLTISSVTFESTSTCFKPPAAPLINSTTAIVLIDSLNKGTILVILSFLDIINFTIAISKLISRAATGLLIIISVDLINSGRLVTPKIIVGIVISNTGSSINTIAKVELIDLLLISKNEQ